MPLRILHSDATHRREDTVQTGLAKCHATRSPIGFQRFNVNFVGHIQPNELRSSCEYTMESTVY